MAEEQKSNLGIIALLILLVGGGVFAATKIFGAKKSNPIAPNNNGTTTKDTPNSGTTPFDIQSFLNGTWHLKATVGTQVYANDMYEIKGSEVYYNGMKTFNITEQVYDSATNTLKWIWTRTNNTFGGIIGEILPEDVLSVDIANKTMSGSQGDSLHVEFNKTADAVAAPVSSSTTNSLSPSDISNFVEGDWNMKISNSAAILGSTPIVVESADIKISNNTITYQGVPRFYIRNTDYGFSNDDKSVDWLLADPADHDSLYNELRLTPDLTKMTLSGGDDNMNKIVLTKYKTPPTIPLDTATNYNDATRKYYPFMLTPQMIAVSVTSGTNKLTLYPIVKGNPVQFDYMVSIIKAFPLVTNPLVGCYAVEIIPQNIKQQAVVSYWALYDENGFFSNITNVNPFNIGKNVATGVGTCFKEDAPVTMVDGKKKKIKDVRRGDIVVGNNNVNNTVENVIVHHGAIGSSLYGFNGSQPFVTKDHPFLTTDGWKSISPKDAMKARPEIKELLNYAIKEGDEIKLINNKKFPIKSIDEYSLTEDIKLYDICVGGNNTFIVYDMIVHNKKTGIEPPPPPKPNKGDVFNHYQILAI